MRSRPVDGAPGRRPARAGEAASNPSRLERRNAVDVEKSYWFTQFEELGDWLAERASRSRRPARVFTIGKTASGRDIPAIEIGDGPMHRPVIIAAQHGTELAGTYGCLAAIDTLLHDQSPTDENITGWADKILKACTVRFVPLVNIDCAIRFRQHVPTCDYSDAYGTGEEEWERYAGDYNEPRYFLEKQGIQTPRYGFTPEQMEQWRRHSGRGPGFRYNDRGDDLYFDYKTFRAPETQAIRDFLKQVAPNAVLELHNHEHPSRVFAPVVGTTTEHGLMQLAYGEEMMTRLFERGLPGSKHSVRTYTYYTSDDYLQFPEYVYQHVTPMIVFAEITTGYLNDYLRKAMHDDPMNRRDIDCPTVTRPQRILTSWSWIHTFLDLGVARNFQ